jgi:pilus assembly protein CpaB
MRLDRKFLLVVGLSLVWAFVVSAMFYRVAAGGGRQHRGAEKSVVLAVQPLPIGAVVKSSSVKLGAVPENLLPAGGFGRVEDVLDRPVISPIQPGEPLIEARLGVRGSGAGLAPLIPPGMRAISVRVNDVVGVAGFVLPGMRVDVLVTGNPPGQGDTMTTTVLQNIVVLSAGQTIQVDAKSQSINTPVVTLLVTPPQAEALTLANNEGKIQLILRNSSDQNVTSTAGRELRELYGQPKWQPPAPVLVPSPKPRTPRAAPAPSPEPRVAENPPETIVIIRGNQKALEPVGSASR